jgi:hypothetical protein
MNLLNSTEDKINNNINDINRLDKKLTTLENLEMMFREQDIKIQEIKKEMIDGCSLKISRSECLKLFENFDKKINDLSSEL